MLTSRTIAVMNYTEMEAKVHNRWWQNVLDLALNKATGSRSYKQ